MLTNDGNTIINSYTKAFIQSYSNGAIFAKLSNGSTLSKIKFKNVYSVPSMSPNNNLLFYEIAGVNLTLENVYYDNSYFVQATPLLSLNPVINGAAIGYSSSALLQQIMSTYNQSIWNKDALRIETSYITSFFGQCNSTSCGEYGVCMPVSKLCSCPSNFFPSASFASCVEATSCNAPNYSNTSSVVISSVYSPQILSNFNRGKWEITLDYSPSQATRRNIKIYNSDQILCLDLSTDLNYELNPLQWTQEKSACNDRISAHLVWDRISDCLQTSSSLFEGKIVSVTSIQNIGYNHTQLSNREVSTTEYTVERLVSFNFSSQISVQSSQEFYYRFGTTVHLILVTDETLDQLALAIYISQILNIPLESFIFLPSNKRQTYTLDLLFLESSEGNSTQLALLLQQLINDGTFAFPNTTTIFASGNQASDFFYKVSSFNFNAANMELTIQINLRMSSPLVVNLTEASMIGNFLPNVWEIESEICGTLYCEQTITLTFYYSNQSCSQTIPNNGNIVLPLSCKSGYNAEACQLFTSSLPSNFSLPLAFEINHCPIQEKTSLSLSTFDLFQGNNALNNGDQLINTNTVKGNIYISVTSKVSGSEFLNASISHLYLSDTLTTVELYFFYFVNTSESSNTVLISFFHSIDPALAPLNFSNAIHFIADISVFFTVPQSKRQIEEKFKTKSDDKRNSAQNFSFVFFSKNFFYTTKARITDSPSNNTPHETTKSSTIAIAVGVSVGVAAIFLVLVSIYLFKKSNKKNHKNVDIETDFERKIELN